MIGVINKTFGNKNMQKSSIKKEKQQKTEQKQQKTENRKVPKSDFFLEVSIVLDIIVQILWAYLMKHEHEIAFFGK